MMSTRESEDEARRLLALAAEDVPPSVDLVAGFQARRERRRFRRRHRPHAGLLIATGAVVAAASIAIAVTLTASPAPAPAPAGLAGPAGLTRAAMITAARNYRVNFLTIPVQPESGPAETTTGSFDPARGAGAETIDGVDIARYDGRYIYLRILPAARKIYEQNFHVILRPGQIWERVTEPKLHRSPFILMTELQAGSVASVQVLSPPGLVALLKGASHVRDTGRVSGPGWTGTAYSFQLSASMPVPSSKLSTIVTTRGTVDIDQQGRIRSLIGLTTSRTPHAPGGDGLTVSSVSLTFSGFGQPIPASIPPASQVIIRPRT